MSLREIVVPETKPETEWMALERWAQGRGEVGTESRFRELLRHRALPVFELALHAYFTRALRRASAPER